MTGQIDGYRQTQETLTGTVYYSEIYTNKNLIKVAEVAPNGQFQVSLPINNPQEISLNIGSRYFTIYAIPCGKLNLSLSNNNCEYKGDGADISKELAFYSEFRKANYSDNHEYLEKEAKYLSPEAFKAKRECILTERLQRIDSLQKIRNFSPEITELLRYKELLYNGETLLSFVDSRKFLRHTEPDNKVLQEPVPSSYYTFLQNMPLEKKEAVSLKEYSEIINNIRFSERILDAKNSVKDTIITIKYTLLTYLLDKNAPLTDEERKLAESHRAFIGSHKVTPALSEALNRQLNVSVYKPFEEKYKAWTDSFNIKLQQDIDAGSHPLNINISSVENDIESLEKRWELCRKIFKEVYPQTPSLASDIFTLQSFIEQLNSVASSEDADILLKKRIDSVSDSTIKEIMKEKVQKRFLPIILPQTKGSEIVHRLITPHKGKYVLLDFWATTCGPCIADINQFSELRKSYSGNPDFAYIFITSSQSSPDRAYKDICSNQLKGEESHRLPTHEYAYIQELFAIYGIPRYVLINREGEIIDDNFSIYQLEKFLNQQKIQKSKSK